jgi:hypothetical protein
MVGGLGTVMVGGLIRLELVCSGDEGTRVASTGGTALGSRGMNWMSVRWLSA